jgi:hypothetical protein
MLPPKIKKNLFLKTKEDAKEEIVEEEMEID